MSFIGPFFIGEKARISLEVLSNGGTPTPVGNPVITRVIGPDGTDVPGYPKPMEEVQYAIYIMEDVYYDVGPYTCVINATFSNDILEQIGEFMVQTRQFGYPKIEVYEGD
jgi:hypothetical protein